MTLQEKLVFYGFVGFIACYISFQMGRSYGTNEAVKWVDQICRAVK